MDHLGHLGAESFRFRDVLAEVPPDRPVPSCPGWNADDLLWHLTEVQAFWGAIVERRLVDPAAAEAFEPDRPTDRAGLVELNLHHSSRLIAALTSAAPATAVWTWNPDDQTVGFVLRRQAHEALIHRVDAELTAGVTHHPIDPGFAVDGVDELLHVMVGGVPDWASFAPDGRRLELVAVDSGVRWTMGFGRMTGTSPHSGRTYDLDAAVVEHGDDVEGSVSGRAADLDLWLWGRAPIERLTVSGDRALADRLRQMAFEQTQ